MGFPVLVVEDDRSFQKIVEIRLRGWRSDVALTFVASLQEAREILDGEHPNFQLVILDQHLPDGRGPELFAHPALQGIAVLAVSADHSPELPGDAVKAGAHHFLGKKQITEPLFVPLVEAILARQLLERQLLETKLKQQKMETIRILLATLRHEINNPLGAVLGGAYLLRSGGTLDDDQREALKLIEASGNRIKDVLQRLCEAAELEEVMKANEQVFQVPGDTPWASKR